MYYVLATGLGIGNIAVIRMNMAPTLKGLTRGRDWPLLKQKWRNDTFGAFWCAQKFFDILHYTAADNNSWGSIWVGLTGSIQIMLLFFIFLFNETISWSHGIQPEYWNEWVCMSVVFFGGYLISKDYSSFKNFFATTYFIPVL